MKKRPYWASVHVFLIIQLFLALPSMAQNAKWPGEFADAPSAFIPPPLNPAGAKLIPEQLAAGVWVLKGDRRAVDNIGVVVGSKRVLVIDSHISEAMAKQALELIGGITDLPISFLVNTNRHGDHVFGNATFPASTIIIGNRLQQLDEAAFYRETDLLSAFTGDPTLFDKLHYRPPDVYVDQFAEIDLGEMVVEIHQVGPVNTAGDMVIHVPSAGVVFTGNLFTAAVVPLLWEGKAADWVRVVDQVSAMNPKRLVAGHLAPISADQLPVMRQYGVWLERAVQESLDEGKSPSEIAETLGLPPEFLPPGPPLFQTLVKGFHAMNVLRSAQMMK